MSQDSKRAAVEGAEKDKISHLPRNIIDAILELLPARDAARTSILSKKWRYVWSELRYLMLDHHFLDALTDKTHAYYIKTVYGILLLHHGEIVKFVLESPEDLSSSSADIDRWIHYVTRNGVQELNLSFNMSDDEDNMMYTLPSYVFSCATLTHLQLYKCVFEPPLNLSFPKLETLHLEVINFEPTADLCVLNVPSLVNLYLIYCEGNQYLDIVSPQLEMLHVNGGHFLVLNCFMKCKKVRELFLRFITFGDNTTQHDRRSTLEKLLFSLAPTVEKLHLDPFIVELFSVDRNPKGPLCMLNCLWFLSLLVNIDKLSETSDALNLIKSVPSLTELEIWVLTSSCSTGATLEYLNTPACLDRTLNKLKHVDIMQFEGTKAELLFIKLLLARTPSLLSMSIVLRRPFGSNEPLSSNERRSITAELMSFPKASPKAVLLFLEQEC